MEKKINIEKKKINSPKYWNKVADSEYYAQYSRDPKCRLDFVLHHMVLDGIDSTRLIIIIC